MDTFTTRNLRHLLSDHVPPCASVYLPTHPAGPEGRQDPVRLKNLLNEVEGEVTAGWMRAVEARQMVQRARELSADPAYWEARSQGLAIFISPNTCEAYRLPLTLEEAVYVGERFVVRPLLPLASGEERFLILALSQNRMQLFEVDRHHVSKVDVPALPTAMKEALNYVAVDRGSQVHSAMQGWHGKQSAVFHGQGGKAEAHKDDLHQFFRIVDAALAPHLRRENVPLLLAGVEYLPPNWIRVSAAPTSVRGSRVRRSS